jgi:DNA-directed RNA polymerase subunit RPC12/RpoP
MYCKKCGAQIDDDSVFCEKCGCQLQGKVGNASTAEVEKPTQMKCSDCGAVMDLSDDATLLFCPYCKSQKLIPMSDNVQIEKIRSNDNKEVSFEKIHSDERIKKEEMRRSNYDLFVFVLIMLLLLAGIMGLMELIS